MKCHEILESLYIRWVESIFFFFKRKSTKSIPNKPGSLHLLQLACVFLLKSTISPVTGIKMELKLHYTAALKKYSKSDANRKMFTIIQLVKFTLHFKVLALQSLFNTRQICRVMEKRNRLLYALYINYRSFTFMSQM